MPFIDQRVDPLPAFRFRVRFRGVELGGFSEASGIQAEIETQEVIEGGENTFVHQLPGRTKHGKLTLRRGLATRELWEWFASLASGKLGNAQVDRRTTTLELSDEDGTPAMRWVYAAAFPSRWNGPDLKADQSLIAVESVEFSHHGFTIEEGVA